MATLYLQRHTQPDIDIQICYGMSDIGLHTDYKSKHLPEVISRLDSVKVSRLYASPLVRCHTLAQDIQERLGVAQISLDPRLLELDFGEWELLPWDEIYKREESKVWFEDFIHTATPGGESFLDLMARAESFMVEMQRLNEDVLAVTHSGFIRAMRVVAGYTTKEETFSEEVIYGGLLKLEL